LKQAFSIGNSKARPCYFCFVNIIDLIIALPLLWFGYKGFSKGAIIELTSILAFGLGIWGGLHFSDFVSELVIDHVSEKYLPIVSFSVVFIAIVIGVFILGKIVEKFVNQINLSVINKIAGAGLGGAKVLLMMSFFITILNRYDQQFEFIPNEIKEESALYFPLCDLSKKVVPAVENSKAFKTGSEEIRDVVAQNH